MFCSKDESVLLVNLPRYLVETFYNYQRPYRLLFWLKASQPRAKIFERNVYLYELIYFLENMLGLMLDKMLELLNIQLLAV